MIEYCESTWISPEPPLRIANKKELIMITDLLGRPVNKTNNTFLLYIYNDGSVIKTITINK